MLSTQDDRPRRGRPRRRRALLLAAAATVGLAGLGGIAFYHVAPYNVAASVPHLPPVRAFLHGYMRNAVGRRSAAIDPPAWFDRDDPALIRLGAAHYATGCAHCHGAPGQRPSPIVLGMLPQPTPIPGLTHELTDFWWLVRHGLKYTGMPAWSGDGRDDEPWAIAAFLAAYDRFTPETYRAAAFGDTPQASAGAAATTLGDGVQPGAALRDSCARCHGADGMGRDGTAPRLAGQNADYLLSAMTAYAEDRRQSGYMEPVAGALSPAEHHELARYFAALGDAEAPAARPTRPGTGDPARGRRLATGIGDAGRVARCDACHRPTAGAEGDPAVPRLAGQDAHWLAVWMRQWRDGPIPEVAGAEQMALAMRGLSDRDIADLAAYFATTAPEPGAPR